MIFIAYDGKYIVNEKHYQILRCKLQPKLSLILCFQKTCFAMDVKDNFKLLKASYGNNWSD